MAKSSPKSATKTPTESTTVRVIVKAEAPFDVLKYGDIRVGKMTAMDVPETISEHRNARWLAFLPST
jgi:hypothetical protein